MTMKKLLAMVLCVMLALSGMSAFAQEEEDKDARIAQLEAEVERLEAYRKMCIVAEFDGGEVLVSELQAQYDYVKEMYAQYGVELEGSGYEETIKQDIVDALAETAVLHKIAETLGLDQIDDETMAGFEQEAMTNFESNVSFYAENYFASQYETDEEATAAATEYLNEAGYGYDALLESTVESYILDNVYDYVTGEIALEDEDVTNYYNDQLATDEETYAASPYSYESARASGTLIAWNPEGYRQVKHILFAFDDDQTTRYEELVSTKESLEAELAAATAPAQTADAAAEATEAAEATAETTQEPARDSAEIQADIDNVNAEIEAVYAEILPEAEAAIERFNAGEKIDDLIAELGEDPGMQQEPALSQGYAVSADSTYYDTAFTEGAMSIAEIGQVSEPVKGSYGVHVIYYEADIPAGAVSLDDLREDIETLALEKKISDAYTAQVEAWKEELNLVTYPENM